MPSRTLFKSLVAVTFGLSLAIGSFPLPSFANGSSGNLRQGLPGRRISGGVREGNCFTDMNQSLVAIMPRNNLGKTAAVRPSFWFSLPATNNAGVEFQLLDDTDELIYSAQIDPSNHGGLSEFQLPESAPELAIDRNYQWILSIGCSEASKFAVKGWVRRVALAPSIAESLATASSEDRVVLYKSAGLWHEQVTELANLRRSNSADMDFQLEWAELIQSTGLTSEVSSYMSEVMLPLEAMAQPTAAETTVELGVSRLVP
jgi:hypothetical protein